MPHNRIQIQRPIDSSPHTPMPTNGTIRTRAATLPLAIVAITALVLILLQSTTVAAQDPRPTNDEIVTHSVTLGDKITVFIDTEIDAEISETRLWRRAHGGDNVAVYSYVEFDQSDRLTATAEIDVKAPSYFPPGTRFDIRFEFVSIDNEVFTSDTYHVEHLGTSKDWRRIADPYLEIIYYGVSDRAIQNLHNQVSPRLPEINDALGVTDSPQYRAVIFPNARELTRYGPRISQAATDGIYFGGYAYDEYDLTIMASPSAEVLVHELTHLIFDRKLTSPYATAVPGWLNEGNSSFWETGTRDKANRQFNSYVRRGDVTEFSKMHNVPGIRADIHRFYIQSADFVGYLHENYGRDSVGKLLVELNDGRSVDQAMQAVFGGNLTEIENRWRAEWRLPPVGTPIESTFSIEPNREVLPTIPGLPTIETGTLTQQPAKTDPFENEPLPLPTIDHAPMEEPQPEVAVVEPQPEVNAPEPQPTVASEPTLHPFLTPEPGFGNYLTGTSEDDWPTVKPSAIIVFFVLIAGFMALMWRRMRT